MSGLDAPDIVAAYDDVRNDKLETNWMLLSYAGAVGNQLALTQTGTGGLSELVSALSDDGCSTATCGSNMPTTRRARESSLCW